MQDDGYLSFAGAGETKPEPSTQDAASTQGAQTQAEPTKPILPEETLTAIRNVVSETLTNFSKQQQSLRDKQEARIKAEVEKQIKAMQQIGVQPTPEQTATLQEVARKSLLEAPEAEKPPEKTPDKSAPVNPYTAEAKRLMTEAGITLERGDPEIKGIRQDSPTAYLMSILEAVNAKKARLEAEKKGKAQAATPMMGGNATPGNPLSGITDPRELLTRGLLKK